MEDSRARSIYRKDTTTEDYYCSYGVNLEFVPLLEDSGLFVSGTDESGDVRVLERRDHPFFFGTLFIPQTRSSKEDHHPLLAAFVDAARKGT